jgi:hypothetical protein
MIKGLTPHASCLDKDSKIINHLVLSTEVLKPQWAQGILEILIARILL